MYPAEGGMIIQAISHLNKIFRCHCGGKVSGIISGIGFIHGHNLLIGLFIYLFI